MAIYEHLEEFQGRPVHEFAAEDGLSDPAANAYRLSLDYDDSEEGRTMAALLETLLADPAAAQLEALVIGPWNGLYDGGEGGDSVVPALVAAAPRLPSLKHLFFGDITAEECEISWIVQTDVTPVLEAFPQLQTFRVRGGNDLKLGPLTHRSLKHLALESGGLGAEVIRTVLESEFPALEHLEFWLGDENYGADATPEDFAPLLNGEAFPNLKYLGIRNAENADAFATALATSPILRRIETLDISLGVLTDEGALALINGGQLSGLKRLDVHHHYISEEVIDGLKASGVELECSDSKLGEDDDYRYVAHSE